MEPIKIKVEMEYGIVQRVILPEDGPPVVVEICEYDASILKNREDDELTQDENGEQCVMWRFSNESGQTVGGLAN